MNFSLEFPIFNPSEAPVKRQNDPLLSSIDTIPCILMNHPFSYETWPTQRCQPQLDLQNLCCCSYLCLGVENWKWKKRWRRRRKMSGRHYCNQCCQLCNESILKTIFQIRQFLLILPTFTTDTYGSCWLMSKTS